MREFFETSAYLGVFLSLAAYSIGMWLKKKTKFALCNPLLVSVILVIAVLLLFDIP